MLKKTLTFKDFDGNDMTRDFYFNLSKPDMIALETSTPGGLSNHVKNLTEKNDIEGITKFVRKLIVESYGERGEDGFSFIKVRNGVKLGEMFEQSLAYEALFMELINPEDNGKAFNDFLTGIVPADLMAKAQAEQAKFLANKNK